MKKISIIIPVFNESKNLLELYRRLVLSTSSLSEYLWEYIFVNDGSSDDSFEVVENLIKSDKRCKLLDLSRNFGKEIALTAGASEAISPDAIICIDADLQHPPELIPELVSAWRLGAEIVVTIRKSTENNPLVRKYCSKIYYWLMSKISGLSMISQTTDFRLYDNKVVEVFKTATERERMFRGIMDWLGFRRMYVEFAAESRYSGEVGYTYGRLIKLAVTSILSFSLWPLRLTGYLGVIIMALSGLLLFWMLLGVLGLTGFTFTPIAVVVVANTFLIGIVLIAIGLVALYVGNIHTQVTNRPLYVIRERVNFE